MAIGGPSGKARGALIAAAIALAPGADAAPAGMTHVIELFTSQGCSSCPPADHLIAGLARAPNTVALSFPVDYWDYIGWKDTFASPSFTARQRAYALSRGDGRVYTPQVVVDGMTAEVGSDKAAIEHDIGVMAGVNGAMTVPIAISEAGGYLHVKVGAGSSGNAGEAAVYVLRVLRSRTVQIARGNNSGANVTYTNVVRAMNKIGDWSGRPATFDMLELKSEDEGYVVLLQTGDPARPTVILAAAKTDGL